MADYALTGNANWSAIKASLSNNDRIVADGLGAHVLTLDEDPALTGIDFVSAAGAYIAIGTPATVTLSGWKIRATTNHGITVGSGKTVTGPFTAYGSTTTASKHGCTVSSGGAIGTVTANGGTQTGAYGMNITGGGTATTVTCTGGSGSTAYGMFSQGTVTTATSNAGSGSGAHGCRNNTTGYIGTATNNGGSTADVVGCQNDAFIATSTNTGGSASGAHGCTNYGSIVTSTNVGGSASGAHGCFNSSGAIQCTSNTGNTSGAFGLDNWGVALSDVRNRVGDYAVRRSRGLLILYGGTSTTGITGTAGDLLYIPTPANTVDGVSVMGESGTYPTTATTNAARDAANAATLEAVKASLKNRTTVTFGASSVTGTLPVNMRPHYRRKAKR
jgi:hypothetical protein